MYMCINIYYYIYVNTRRRPSFSKRFIYCLLGANIFLSLFEPPKRDDFTGKSLCRRRTRRPVYFLFVRILYRYYYYYMLHRRHHRGSCVVHTVTRRARTRIRIPILYIIICTYVYTIQYIIYIIIRVPRLRHDVRFSHTLV
jgi:hypothetical protein